MIDVREGPGGDTGHSCELLPLDSDNSPHEVWLAEIVLGDRTSEAGTLDVEETPLRPRLPLSGAKLSDDALFSFS